MYTFGFKTFMLSFCCTSLPANYRGIIWLLKNDLLWITSRLHVKQEIQFVLRSYKVTWEHNI